MVVDDVNESLHVVISGGSSGIGAALVKALSADGHRLFVCARDGKRLRAKQEGNINVLGRACDVSNEDQVVGFMDWVRQHTAQLDALINCAGIQSAIGPITETDSNEWLQTVRVNLFGTYLMCKHAIPLMYGSAAPRIVNFSGGGAFNPVPNYSAYACSKAGVVRLTECLAVELASRGIRVNAVAPGFMATPIHRNTLDAGPERAGKGQYEAILRGLEAGTSFEPVVECVRFLLSVAADSLTAKTISVKFDPWREPAFLANIEVINDSELFTMRRVVSTPTATPSVAKLLERAEEMRPRMSLQVSVAPRRRRPEGSREEDAKT